MVTGTKRAMVMAMKVKADKEGNGDGGKSNGNGIKGDRGVTAKRALVTRAVGE
jgi:hypothetical protein